MAEIQTTGIVIRKSNLGEADRLLTILTPTHGKLRALAKGVRKPKARLSAWLDMFRYNNFSLASGRSFFIVTGAQTHSVAVADGMDWDRLTVAYYMCELVDKLVDDNQVLSGIFELTQESLAGLSAGVDEELVRASFELKLMDLLGTHPQLQSCAVSGEKLNESAGIYFSLRLGGTVSGKLALEDDFAREVDANTVKLMRLLATHPLSAVAQVKFDQATKQQALLCISDFMAYILESRPKSLSVASEF